MPLINLHELWITDGIDELVLGDEVGGLDGSADAKELVGVVVVLDLEGVEEGVAELFFGEVFNHLRIMVTEGRCLP